jgi:hypothetical protein
MQENARDRKSLCDFTIGKKTAELLLSSEPLADIGLILVAMK